MSCVHYKFSSKLNYDTVTFDGLHITLSDLKRQIMGREKLKAADCDLQITNAQTKEGKSWYMPFCCLDYSNTFERFCIFVVNQMKGLSMFTDVIYSILFLANNANNHSVVIAVRTNVTMQHFLAVAKKI